MDLTDGRIYSEKEAAAVLGVTVRTLYNLRRAGLLHCTRAGRLVRYTSRHLSEFIARGDTSRPALPERARRSA
jgi:excisionase family DNA binding protein